MPERDEFTPLVKRAVAERAAYQCSNPDCRTFTIGPHSQPEKSLSKGIAAHICAAAPGGPRFDPNQTQEERSDISNAIWLCHNCSDVIDKDEQKYTKEILLKWKTDHEKFIMEGGGFPGLPKIVLETLNGLTSESLGRITIEANDVATFREHILSIHNLSNRTMPYFKCRIQFPEPIIKHRISDSPTGSVLKCEPDVMKWVGFATGSGSSTVIPGNSFLDYKLSVDIIPPRSQLCVHFLSIQSKDFLNISRLPNGIDMGLLYHILGEFQYTLHNEFLERRFLVLLEWDSAQRKITSLPCEDDDGSRRIAIRRS